MPCAAHRRTIEVSADLYERLRAEADATDQTTPAMLAGIIKDAETIREDGSVVAGRLAAVEREQRGWRGRGAPGTPSARALRWVAMMGPCRHVYLRGDR